jgi:hypothetical protein
MEQELKDDQIRKVAAAQELYKKFIAELEELKVHFTSDK